MLNTSILTNRQIKLRLPLRLALLPSAPMRSPQVGEMPAGKATAAFHLPLQPLAEARMLGAADIELVLVPVGAADGEARPEEAVVVRAVGVVFSAGGICEAGLVDAVSGCDVCGSHGVFYWCGHCESA